MPTESLHESVVTLLQTALGLESDWVKTNLEIPADRKMGDLAFPCFKLAKEKRMAPAQIAAGAVASLPHPLPVGIHKIEAVGP